MSMELRLLSRQDSEHRRKPSLESQRIPAADPIVRDLEGAAERHKDRPKFLNDYAHIYHKPQPGLREVFDLIVKLPPGVLEPPHLNSGQ